MGVAARDPLLPGTPWCCRNELSRGKGGSSCPGLVGRGRQLALAEPSLHTRALKWPHGQAASLAWPARALQLPASLMPCAALRCLVPARHSQPCCPKQGPCFGHLDTSVTPTRHSVPAPCLHCPSLLVQAHVLEHSRPGNAQPARQVETPPLHLEIKRELKILLKPIDGVGRSPAWSLPRAILHGREGFRVPAASSMAPAASPQMSPVLFPSTRASSQLHGDFHCPKPCLMVTASLG